MAQPHGQELIDRYKRNYHFPESFDISEEMILRHWQLEKELVQELMTSTPETRWETFERAYTQLYSELNWLNESGGQQDKLPASKRFAI